MRAAGGEGDLVGPHAQRVGRGLPRVVEQQPCVAAGAVQPARVGVPPVEGGQEHLARRRVQRRRGRAVEVGGPGRRGSHRGNLCHAQPPARGRTDPDLRRSADTRPCPARRGQMGILSVCREGPRERLVSGSASPQPFRRAPAAHPEGRAAGRDDAGAGRMFRGRHAPDPQPRDARPGHRAGSLHLRALEVGLGRRHGDRRHRLGPHLLRRGEVPPPQRRRGARGRRATTCRSRSSTRSPRS